MSINKKWNLASKTIALQWGRDFPFSWWCPPYHITHIIANAKFIYLFCRQIPRWWQNWHWQQTQKLSLIYSLPKISSLCSISMWNFTHAITASSSSSYTYIFERMQIPLNIIQVEYFSLEWSGAEFVCDNKSVKCM